MSAFNPAMAGMNRQSMDGPSGGPNASMPVTYGQAPSGAAGQGPTWESYFGTPPRPLDLNPYDAMRRENLALPEAYKGHNMYLTQVIIQLVTADDMWPGTIALPFRVTESQMEIVWDEIHFNNHLLGPVPEEGVSRLVTQQVSERRDHFVRYGLAFMLEHGFMKTQKGQLCYKSNLEQIRNAVLETVYIGVLEAFLRCKTVSQVWTAKYGAQASASRVRTAMAQEVEDWACVQKTEHGFDLLDSRAKKQLKWMGVQADMWILPEGAKVYLGAVRKENFDFFLRGPGGEQSFRDTLADKMGKGYVDVNNDCAVYEAKQFEVPGQAEPVDVLQRQQTIGEYYVMHGARGTDWKEYNSAARDILVYNEERDSFSRISLEACIDNCCRFQPESRRESGALDWSSAAPGDLGEHDMFKTSDGGFATRFGDMSSDALQREALLDMAAGIMGGLDDKLVRNIEAGLQLCRDIEMAPPSDKEQELYPAAATAHAAAVTNAIAAGNAVPAPPAGPAFKQNLAKAYTNITDTPGWTLDSERNLPIPDPAHLPDLPTGYATWPGMEVLARGEFSATNAGKTAKKFVDAFNKLYERLDEVVYDSCFLDADYQAPWFKKPDGRNVLFTSLAHVVHPPLWITGGGGDAEASGAAALKPIDQVISGYTVGIDDAVKSAAAKAYIESVTGNSPTTDRVFDNDGRLNQQTYTSPDGLEKVIAMLLCSVTAGTDWIIRPYAAVSQDEANLMRETAQLFMACLPVERANLVSDDQDKSFPAYVLALLFALKKMEGVKLVDIYRLIRKISTAKNKNAFYAGSSALQKVYADAVGGAKDNLAAAFDTKFGAIDFAPAPVGGGGGGAPPAPVYYSKVSLVPDATKRQHHQGQNIPTALTGSKALADSNSLPVVFTIGYSHDSDPAKSGFNPHSNTDDDRKKHLQRRVFAAMDVGETPVAGFGSRLFGVRRDREFDGGFVHDHNEREANGQRRRFGLADEDTAKRARWSDMETWGDNAVGNATRQMRGEDVGAAGGMYVQFTKDFSRRFREFGNLSNPVQRMITQAFLGARICSKSLRQLVHSDVPFPFGFLLFRPWMTYRMGTGILAKAGRETGETLIGHADFQLSDNVIQKMHYGNFTMYLKSIVIKQQNVYLAENMYAMGYVGGNDCRFFTHPDQLHQFMESGCGRSMFACLVPYDARNSDPTDCAWMCDYPNPIDITGTYQTSRIAPCGNQQHYASAGFYSNYWRWQHSQDPDSDMPYFSTYSKWNTLCYQGHQAMYNPTSRKFDVVVENTGHWGNRVYPGCGRVRRGLQKLLEPVQYNTLYGGGAKTVMQIGN